MIQIVAAGAAFSLIFWWLFCTRLIEAESLSDSLSDEGRHVSKDRFSTTSDVVNILAVLGVLLWLGVLGTGNLAVSPEATNSISARFLRLTVQPAVYLGPASYLIIRRFLIPRRTFVSTDSQGI